MYKFDLKAAVAGKRGDRVRTALGIAAGSLVLAGSVLIWGPGLLRSGIGRAGVDPIARFLLAISVIVLLSHLLGGLLGKLGQPPVIGEILGGLVLGPSVLGAVWPAGRQWLFPPDVVDGLGMAAQLGLVTFMFLLGSELQVRHAGVRGKVVGFVVAGGLGLPFLGGLGIVAFTSSMTAGAPGYQVASALFVGLAVSVTALPVLARILVELRMDTSTVGVIALTCAAIGDGLAWAVLTVILAVRGAGDPGQVGTTIGLAVALVTCTALCVRPLLGALVPRIEQRSSGQQPLLATLVACAIGFAAFTQLIGLHPAIGAFLFGAVLPRTSPAVRRIGRQLNGFVVTVLLPVFFAGVGLSTSIGLLGGSLAHWSLLAGVLLVTSATKLLGTAGAARLAGMSAGDALRLGTLLNCRGVTELVIAEIGLQYQLINQFGFTVLVLVALITTAATSGVMGVVGRGIRPTVDGQSFLLG